MSLETVDTFEHDIATEIKEKEATIGDIASASNDVGNIPVSSQNSSLISILIITFILLLTLLVAYFGYTYYNNKVNPPENTAVVVIPDTNDISLLKTLSPQFEEAIGRYIRNVSKSPYGYTLTIASSNAYSSIFAYMLKNEPLYADDIASALNQARDTSTTTIPFIFSDRTINNQNIRVGISGSSSIMYAFINTQALVIATSTEAIMTLRSDILH